MRHVFLNEWHDVCSCGITYCSIGFQEAHLDEVEDADREADLNEMNYQAERDNNQ